MNRGHKLISSQFISPSEIFLDLSSHSSSALSTTTLHRSLSPSLHHCHIFIVFLLELFLPFCRRRATTCRCRISTYFFQSYDASSKSPVLQRGRFSFIQYTHKHRGWKYFLPIKTVGNYTFSTSDFSDNKNDLVINEISEDDVNDFRDQIRLLRKSGFILWIHLNEKNSEKPLDASLNSEWESKPDAL